MISGSELRKGVIIEHDEKLYQVIEYHHVKMKRTALARVKMRDLEGGQLGVSQIFLQVRGELNTRAHDMHWDPSGGNTDGSWFDAITLSHWQTLPYEQANSEAFGRRILINHATGRLRIENFIPLDLDYDYINDVELRFF